MGLSGEERELARWWRMLPLPQSELDKGRVGGPLLPSLSSSFPLLLLQLGKEGVLLPVGVGLLLARLLLACRLSLPCSFIYRGRGTSRHTS